MAATPDVAHIVASALSLAADLHTIVLYGSAARGELRTGGEMESDVDVAVADRKPDSLARAVGLRNLAAHDYSALDWMRLHAFLPDALADLRRFAARIAESSDSTS